jgi:hypothetical protein
VSDADLTTYPAQHTERDQDVGGMDRENEDCAVGHA